MLPQGANCLVQEETGRTPPLSHFARGRSNKWLGVQTTEDKGWTWFVSSLQLTQGQQKLPLWASRLRGVHDKHFQQCLALRKGYVPVVVVIFRKHLFLYMTEVEVFIPELKNYNNMTWPMAKFLMQVLLVGIEKKKTKKQRTYNYKMLFPPS